VRIKRHSEGDTRWEVRNRKGVSRSYLAVKFPVNDSLAGEVVRIYIVTDPVEIAQWVSSSCLADGNSGSWTNSFEETGIGKPASSVNVGLRSS
jgi:hypothetical protein